MELYKFINLPVLWPNYSEDVNSKVLAEIEGRDEFNIAPSSFEEASIVLNIDAIEAWNASGYPYKGREIVAVRVSGGEYLVNLTFKQFCQIPELYTRTLQTSQGTST
jgi:hypothetical protein